MSFTIFQNKKTPFQAIKTQSSKSQKIDIFPKGLTHSYGQKRPCFQLFLLGNIGQENVLYHILERKNVFLGYKNKNFKTSKIERFPQGLTHGFGPKMVIFPVFFLANIGQENVFYDIQEQKNSFLGDKNKSSKSLKIDIFPEGLAHGFGPKIAIFPTFFFSQYRPEKCLLPYSRTKKHLFRL